MIKDFKNEENKTQEYLDDFGTKLLNGMYRNKSIEYFPHFRKSIDVQTIY